jgi:hypothetical protein
VTRGTHEIMERQEIKEDKIPAIKALKTTITNKSFLLIQGALLVVALGIGIDATCVATTTFPVERRLEILVL